MTETIWYENINGLFTETNYYKIIPVREMTLQEKLNALLRFFVYLGILLALIKSNYKYLLLGIITALITIIINKYELQTEKETEKFLDKNNLTIVDNKICTRSTVENPFMNLSIADISLNPEHPQACDVENYQVKKSVAKNFYSRVFRDVNDIYSKDASERQFYTMPCTQVANDQTEFGKWLYINGGSGKDGNSEQCWRNIAGVDSVHKS
jgi:hypothetical protein